MCVLTFAFTLALTLSVVKEPPMRQKLVINTSSPEGMLLQRASDERDPLIKIAMAKEFVEKYPSHPGLTYALGILEETALETRQYDVAIDAAHRALTIDPNDLDIAYNGLKAAEGKKDPASIREFAGATASIANDFSSSAKPPDVDEEAWNKQLAYAKDVSTYADYAVFSAAMQTKEPASIVLLVEGLEQQNPKSAYLNKAYTRYFSALTQSGKSGKVMAAAERARSHFPDHEDALIILADGYFAAKDANRALSSSLSLLRVMKTKAKPEEVSSAEWERKRGNFLGRGYYIAGIVQAGQSLFIDSDQNLRSALPLIKGDATSTGVATFYLSVVNFKLAEATRDRTRLAQSLAFAKQSAGIAGPFQQQAWRNSIEIDKTIAQWNAAPARR